MNYGKALKRCMANAGEKTFVAAEERTGVSSHHLVNYAKGKTVPSGSTMARIASGYGLTVPQFILLATEIEDLKGNLWVLDEFFATIIHKAFNSN